MKYMILLLLSIMCSTGHTQLTIKDGEQWAKEHGIMLSPKFEVDMGVAGHAAPIVRSRDGGLVIMEITKR